MKKIVVSILILAVFLGAQLYAVESFRCAKNTPVDLQLPRVKECNELNFWGDLEPIRQTDVERFIQLVTEQVTQNNNFSGAKFTFPSGVTKDVYRSSMLSENEACINTLAKERGVESIVYLYSGSIKTHTGLSDKERVVFKKAGGKQYVHILNYDYKFDEAKKEDIVAKVKEIVLAIQNAPGNVLVHCFGGMHRTGLVFAVMQKCLNKLPIESVLNEYKCHVAWESELRPGGYSKDNEEVIRDFECKILFL